MHTHYIARNLEKKVWESLEAFPAVAILGPRQSGKSTLAKAILGDKPDGIYLDLERPSDLRKLAEPELFFDLHKESLICLDEVQRTPEIFPVLRSVIDERGRKGQFLILGSASPGLIRQTSETLAGRIAYLELTPFLLSETEKSGKRFEKHWLRGGFPNSFLARSEAESFPVAAKFCTNLFGTGYSPTGHPHPLPDTGAVVENVCSPSWTAAEPVPAGGIFRGQPHHHSSLPGPSFGNLHVADLAALIAEPAEAPHEIAPHLPPRLRNPSHPSGY